MAVSQADIDALNAALARGERQVTLGSQTVTYRSASEIIAARNDLLAQMAREQGKRRPKQFRLYQNGRGY